MARIQCSITNEAHKEQFHVTDSTTSSIIQDIPFIPLTPAKSVQHTNLHTTISIELLNFNI